MPEHALLPVKLRILFVAKREPAWTGLALQLDRCGCGEPEFRWTDSPSQALALVRQQSFDVIVVRQVATVAVALVEAFRGGGCETPLLIQADQWDASTWEMAAGLNAEWSPGTTSGDGSGFGQWIARTLQRAELSRDNERLSLADRRRHVQEQGQSEEWIASLRKAVELPDDLLPQRRRRLPAEAAILYYELLRTRILMADGNLRDEVADFARLLAASGCTARETVHLHLDQLSRLIEGLGSRSSRHVLSRAGLLLVELLAALGDHFDRSFGLGEGGIDLLHHTSLRQKSQSRVFADEES